MFSKIARIVAILIWWFAVTAAASGSEPTYVVVAKLPLTEAANGVDSTLQLLIDNRLTNPLRREMWGTGDWSFVLLSDSPLYKEFSILPPMKAKLLIKDVKGSLVAERTLEMPLARLQAWEPSSHSQEFFLVTQDFSIGFGSYNGPKTVLLQVSSAAFRDVTALDQKTNTERPFRLMRSLKSDWRLATEKKNEILSVTCHPKSDGEFSIDYVRYSFDGSRWIEYEREAGGLWESGDGFPRRSRFP